jgi:hypothetical protein
MGQYRRRVFDWEVLYSSGEQKLSLADPMKEKDSL